MSVDKATFFAIMGAFPTGVTIVTTMDQNGEPKGLTSNAVASVSAEPPLMLVCVDKRSNTLEALRARRPVVAVGIAFATQQIDAIIADATDQRLDLILTELEVVDPIR